MTAPQHESNCTGVGVRTRRHGNSDKLAPCVAQYGVDEERTKIPHCMLALVTSAFSANASRAELIVLLYMASRGCPWRPIFSLSLYSIKLNRYDFGEFSRPDYV